MFVSVLTFTFVPKRQRQDAKKQEEDGSDVIFQLVNDFSVDQFE